MVRQWNIFFTENLKGVNSRGCVFTISAIMRILSYAIGLGIMFSKDPFIKSLERGMSQNQKEKFQREIEDYKESEGRGGADNLDKDILREIAEWIKRVFR